MLDGSSIGLGGAGASTDVGSGVVFGVVRGIAGAVWLGWVKKGKNVMVPRRLSTFAS